MNYFDLLNPDYTCVLLYNNQVIYNSKDNSVKPFVKYIYYNGVPSEHVILIDKIIGLAIANVVLYCKLKTVYAKTISVPALNLLHEHNVDVHYETLVDHILRRDKSDICPMEKKISEATSPSDAYHMLKEIVIHNNKIHLH